MTTLKAVTTRCRSIDAAIMLLKDKAVQYDFIQVGERAERLYFRRGEGYIARFEPKKRLLTLYTDPQPIED